ncbi:MAG: extracellular solute-binding protein [Alphaproteobacteria bacterium]|nr:extracellular solute-binding protein [Alphaproteobacteria bacterium]
MNLDRRSLLTAVGAAGLTAAWPNRGRTQTHVERITVTSYGGVWETAVRDTFVADFTRRTGVKADIQIGGPPQWIAQVEANQAKPPIDVIVSTVDLALVAGRKGLVEPISVHKVPNLADVPKFFVDICEGWGACFDYGAGGIAYHKGRVKNPPKSLKEFVERTARGDWRASLPTIAFQPGIQLMVWSLNDALGGTLEDISPAINAVKSMKKNAMFWTSVTDFLTHLESGEADIGLYYDGRVWAHYDTGATWIDFINPAEGAVMTPVAVMKAKNAPAIAWEYVNSMLAPEPGAKFAEMLNFGMTNQKIVYSEKTKARITPWDKTRFPPVDKMGAVVPQWVERWNKEVR